MTTTIEFEEREMRKFLKDLILATVNDMNDANIISAIFVRLFKYKPEYVKDLIEESLDLLSIEQLQELADAINFIVRGYVEENNLPPFNSRSSP